MQCNSCNSDNVQKLSMVYEQGTQNIEARGRTVGSGVGIGRGGLSAGFGTATTKTKGKSQSIAAKKAAPPDKKPLILPAGLIIAGFIGIFGLSYTAIGLLLIAIGGFLFWKYYQYNTQTYPPLYSKWEQSWLCNKCGTIYMQ